MIKEEGELRKKLEKIAEIDETFKFEIKDGILEVESEDKDKAYRRGVWLKSKIEELKNCGFEVIKVK